MKRNSVAWAALIVASAALISSSGFLRSMPAAPKAPLEGQQAAQALSQAFVTVAEFARPSVVQITVQKKSPKMPNMPGMPNVRRFQFPPGGNGPMGPGDMRDFEEMLRRFFGPGMAPNPSPRKEHEQFGFHGNVGVGSGFVYDDHGHILTNNHVVENAEKIEVSFYDGVKASAKVVGTDKQTDVAVIQVESTSYSALPRGDSDHLKVGELVMAVGSPFNLSQSVTTGIISALDRNNLGINGQTGYESFIQTDAPINRGNSGGPLLNMNGEVIGINSAIMSGSSGNDGIGFAIPLKLASSVADMIIKDGKVHYARIGIELAPLTPALSRQLGLDESTKGVLVGNVVSGSPAEKAGLKQGDVIVGFAGAPVRDSSSFRLKVATSEVSRSYEIDYLRDGKKKTGTIVPAPAEKVVFEQEREGGERADGSQGEPSKPEQTAIGAFGMDVQPLTGALSKSLGLKEGTKGVIVSSVASGGAADNAGIEEGDVITQVIHNHKFEAVTSVEQLKSLASKADELALRVERPKLGGRFVTLSKTDKEK